MSVTIRRERADQRRHHRVTAPFYVTYADQRLRAADWSLGGLRISSFPGKLPAIGDEIDLQLSLPFQGFEVSFDAKAQVLRLDQDTKMFACQYTQLGDRERELMSHFIEDLVRGSMADVKDTIARIDLPVTPASLKPDNDLPAEIPLKRMSLRTMAFSGFYAIFGAFVFGYIALLIYSNFYRLEVQTAVISAPVEAVAAQGEGRLGLTNLRPGDVVRRGEIVVRLFDNQLEREIDMAGIAIDEEKASLSYLRQRLADELVKMRGFAAIENKTIAQDRLKIEALAAQLMAAKNNFKRLDQLLALGHTTKSKHDEANQRVVTAQKRLASLRVEVASRVALAKTNVGLRHYTGQNMVGDTAKLRSQTGYSQNKIRLATRKYNVLLNARRRLAVIAPYDGTILELPRVNQGHVKRGDIVAIIEQRRARHVTAFLTQDEVQKIGLGDQATVYVPAVGKTLTGHVKIIDRTSGFIKEQEQRHRPGYNWRGPTDRSAKVVLAFDKPELVQDFETYRSGLPVVVLFSRRSTNPITGPIAGSVTRRLTELLGNLKMPPWEATWNPNVSNDADSTITKTEAKLIPGPPYHASYPHKAILLRNRRMRIV